MFILYEPSGILDCDWPVATFQGMIFPDSHRLKLVAQHI